MIGHIFYVIHVRLWVYPQLPPHFYDIKMSDHQEIMFIIDALFPKKKEMEKTFIGIFTAWRRIFLTNVQIIY